MPEQLPEQPGLPIFEDKQVGYSVVHDKDTEESDQGEPVRLSASEIDNIPDTRIREALWSQLRNDLDPRRRTAIFVLANEDHSFRHSFSVPTKPIGLVFTSEGAFNNYEEIAEAKKNQQKPAGFFRRVFRRMVS